MAVGKTFRDYDAREDYKPQFFAVEHILYRPGYNDLAGYYSNDIAVLVLDKVGAQYATLIPYVARQRQ